MARLTLTGSITDEDFAFEVRVQAKSSHFEAACGNGMWEARVHLDLSLQSS